MHNVKIESKQNKIVDALASNERYADHMRFAIAEAEKELAALESDIQLLQGQAGDVAAEAYLQGKPKLLETHQGKVDKAIARKDALELALGSLRLRLGVLGQVRGHLNRQESLFAKFEALLDETLAGIEEFREVRSKLDAVPKGTPEVRRMILREHELTRDSWGRVPTLVKQLGVMATDLDLYQPARDILTDAGVEINPSKIAVMNEKSWWIQTGSRARSA